MTTFCSELLANAMGIENVRDRIFQPRSPKDQIPTLIGRSKLGNAEELLHVGT